MNRSKECDWVVDALPEFLAGRLPQAEGERVRLHLEGCAECRNRANAVSLLQQTPVPKPDPGRWDEFVDGVVEETGRRRWSTAVRLASVAAVILLMLAGGELIRRQLDSDSDPPQTTLETLARDVAALPEAEAAAWTAGVAPISGIPELDVGHLSAEELEELVTEVGRT